ncbi:hypothetical protein [Nonomuraea sp. SYSU D8015]|uniref:hypothetical protein n=1 Tax=Nonomuraea sp. SYSU D8015 TaxID=2593644 RepID=UPI00166049CC|nr:hypothetical protein [Nonomuraea sp. SYSU D8015]
MFIIADLMGEVSSDGVLLASLLGFGVTWFHIARLDPDIRGRPVAVTSIITAVVTVAALILIEI